MRRWICCALLLATSVFAQSSSESTQRIKELFDQGRWAAVVAEVYGTKNLSPDVDYYYGTALAQLSRWDEARVAFLAGQHLQPKDKRFPTELGGIAFRQKKYSLAEHYLQQALRLDPKDEYSNNFLATIYYLQDNLEAALKYWNRAAKPKIEGVGFDPVPRVRPALLDRAFAFAQGATLKLPDLLTSRRRVEALGIFSTYDFKLAARDDGRFDLGFNAQERNGFGDSKLEALISTFSGVPYQTVYPAYYNFEKSAVNMVSLFRWDAQKRRAAVSISGPWRLNPKWRFSLGLDLRNENWALRQSFTGPAPVLGSLNLRREVGSAKIESVNSGRWGWAASVEASHRDYRNVAMGTAITPDLLLRGYQLKQVLNARYELLRVPERRFVVETRGRSELARIWSQPSQSFAKLQGEVDSQWLPQSHGDDYRMQSRITAGKTFGMEPFDELFMLGLERDNDLLLRAHIGTRDGIKGSAPLGRSYFLSNWEIDKNLYNNGLLGLKLGPFVDSGKMFDTSAAPASPKWLFDTGAQLKVEALGVGAVFSYGKDLRTGNNAFYVRVGKALTNQR